jgi:hypothetical protein
MGTKIYDLVTFTLVFDLLFERLNLEHNVQMASTKALIILAIIFRGITSVMVQLI